MSNTVIGLSTVPTLLCTTFQLPASTASCIHAQHESQLLSVGFCWLCALCVELIISRVASIHSWRRQA